MNTVQFTFFCKPLAMVCLTMCCTIVILQLRCSDPEEIDKHSCSDGVQNGLETDIDCGGDGECDLCEVYLDCQEDKDCRSGLCNIVTKTCNPEYTCTDGIISGSESDLDCGGDCSPCEPGKICNSNFDCVSIRCNRSTAPWTCHEMISCNDGMLNGYESDVDCGGERCPPCPDGGRCSVHSDCIGDYCAGFGCSTASCDDLVQNGNEEGVDCGGDCRPCWDCTGLDLKENGDDCFNPAECCSGRCVEGACCLLDPGEECLFGRNMCCGEGAVCMLVCGFE